MFYYALQAAERLSCGLRRMLALKAHKQLRILRATLATHQGRQVINPLVKNDKAT